MWVNFGLDDDDNDGYINKRFGAYNHAWIIHLDLFDRSFYITLYVEPYRRNRTEPHARKHDGWG